MGQKIRPDIFRLGINKDWQSRWFAKNNLFKNQLEEDLLIRRIINQKLKLAGIVKIEIERGTHNAYRITIKAAKPGLIIGRGGRGIEEISNLLESNLKKLFRKKGIKNPAVSLNLNVEELRRTEISAPYAAQMIAWDLERRLRARRVIKSHLENLMNHKEVKGVKIKISGRIDGAEIARREWVGAGKLPLHTLRADIDYGEATAFNNYGTVGVKVWIYKGEIFEK
jgi:small subunit ribosomal protein S3